MFQRHNSFKTKPEWTGVAKSKSFVSETPPESPTVKENNDVRSLSNIYHDISHKSLQEKHISSSIILTSLYYLFTYILSEF